MGFFDFFKKEIPKKEEKIEVSTPIQPPSELQSIKDNMSALSRDVDELVSEVRSNRGMIKRVYEGIRLALQTHDEVKKIKQNYVTKQDLESALQQFSNTLQQTSNIPRKTATVTKKAVATPPIEEAGITAKINKLSPSLKRLCNILAESDFALTYDDIAQKLGLKKVTARSYVFRLSETGIPIDIKKMSGNIVTVSLPKKVRALYNYQA